jgi:hypothetical protein
MLQTIAYITKLRLSCADCDLPADIVICIIPGLAAAGPTIEFINAQLVSYTKNRNSCGTMFYRYVFEYDDEQLLIPEAGITEENITGVICKGCLTKWLESLIAIEQQAPEYEDPCPSSYFVGRPITP